MLILLIMTAGVLFGLFFFPKKLKKANEKLQLAATTLLIFSMGIKLGSRENFLHELGSVGFQSLVYAIVPIFFSVLTVYLLTQRFMKPGNSGKKEEQ